MLKIGDPTPAFSLRSSDQTEVTEQHFAGSILVLAFYPMAFTAG